MLLHTDLLVWSTVLVSFWIELSVDLLEVSSVEAWSHGQIRARISQVPQVAIAIVSAIVKIGIPGL